MSTTVQRLVILLMFASPVLYAQDRPLSLADALSTALQNNPDLAFADLDESIARARFDQTMAVWLPQLKVSYTAMSTNNPLNAFGFKLQQQSITAADFNPALLNNPSTTQNFMTKAEWMQPLVNMDMLAMRQAARDQVQVAHFKRARMRDYVAMQVRQAYAQLQLAHQARAVMEESLATARVAETSTRQRFDQGYLQKSDVLHVQVQVSMLETKLAEANTSVHAASDMLSLLMKSTTGVVYQVDSMQWEMSAGNEAQVAEQRADFQAMRSAIQALGSMASASRLSFVPKLNAFGEYLINDKSATGFGSSSYLVGAQLSWSLFTGMTTRNKVREYSREQEKTQQQLVYEQARARVELEKSMRQLEDARLSVHQYDVAVGQASEALRIIENRYQQGLVTTPEYLQAQTLLSQQKLYRAQAIFQYNTTRAYLEFLTSTSENN